MSAIDEMRRLLDERGVEYEGGERSLRWRDRHGIMMQAFPLANGELGMGVWSCTPEQAIAATLGDADLAAENAELRELLLDYDKMLAIAADELGYQSRGLRMDSVLNALRIRMYELGIEVDE